jgi:flagella basal body P-ring formation protein FlgA
MTARILIFCLVFCLGVRSRAAGQTPCAAVTGAQILGGDLARVVPAFKAVPPGVALAPSPLHGAVRTFPVSELQALASRFGVNATFPADVCFRFAQQPLDRARVIEVMTEALNISGVRIEIVDTSDETMPVGRIEFRREALGIPVRSDRVLPIVWRGDVIYAGDRRFTIWARVKITAPVTRLIAVESLRPGVPVKPGQVREEVAEVFPLSSGSRPSLSQIEGLMPLRSIAPGAEIRSDDVGQPYAVNRGDLVHVEVRSGAARLALTGRAESAGRAGDLVPVRNLDSSRVFQARVEGKDSVIVLVRDVEEALK